MGIYKQIQKNVRKNINKFITEMYITLPGSLCVCNYMLCDDKPDINELNKKMKKLMRNPSLLIPFDDENYIDKTLEYFNMKRADNLSIALVVGKYNQLFAPYIDGELYPLREDGIYSNTLKDKNSKIIPIKF